MKSAYYDTCVFLVSLNGSHKEQGSCSDLLNVTTISWPVRICTELIVCESSVEEFVRNFETHCVAHGVEIRDIDITDANAIGKKHQRLKKILKQKGFGGRDWTHLMAAVVSDSDFLCTVDSDFWDPENKANKKAKKQKCGVKSEIEKCLPIQVTLPSELLRFFEVR